MTRTPNLQSARKNARFAADSVFRRPQLAELVLGFEDRARRLQEEAERHVSTETDSGKRQLAQEAIARYQRAQQIAQTIRDEQLKGRDLQDAIVEFSDIMFDRRHGQPRWRIPKELFPYNDDELRVINNTARAEGLMGARLPSKRYYKEARVAGGFGAAIAFRLAFLKEQIEAGVKIDTVVLLASTEAPPTTGKSTGYWLNNFVDENFPDVAEMKTRAVEVDSSGPVRTQFDVALACAYVILGEKLLDRPQHIPASPGGYYTEKPSPKLGGAKLLVLGAEPSNGKAATYADQAALLEHIDYDRAQPHEPLLHNGTSVYPWFEHQMLRQHTIRVGQRTEIAGYNKVTPRIANFDPPKPRALWENHGDAEDFIQGRHAAETAGNKSRVDSFNDVVPEYVQELSSLIGEAHGLILDIDRFEREQPLESALVL